MPESGGPGTGQWVTLMGPGGMTLTVWGRRFSPVPGEPAPTVTARWLAPPQPVLPWGPLWHTRTVNG